MRTRRFVATAAAAAMSLSLVAAHDGSAPIPVTETVYISAGCPQDTPGTCTSTRWLGKVSGDSASNFITAITPVDEVQYRASGAINWRDYASDASFGDYLLDVDRDLGIRVLLSAQGVGANVTVHARARMRLVLPDGSVRNETITATPTTVTAITAAAPTPVDIALDLPAAWAGRTLDTMTVDIAVHGVNVAAGYIDQRGGSPVTIPHLVSNH